MATAKEDSQNLESFLTVKGAAMSSYYDGILSSKKDDEVVKDVSAKTTVEGRSGVRRITIRDHQIISDSPPAWCGYDLGASAPEILLGALSSCITHIYLVLAGIGNIRISSLEVETSGSLDLRKGMKGHENEQPGIQNLNFVVNLTSNESEEALKELHTEVQKVCPLYVCI